MRYAFLEFQLDEQLFELTRSGAKLPIPPKGLDLLLYLLRNRERVITKEELLECVWKGVKVQANTLAQTVTGLRRALDDENPARVIETIRARGYRFIAEVREVHASPSHVAGSAFVGRESLIQELLARLDAAKTRRPAIVLIPGAPGLGKTRLLAELAELGRARGARVAQAHCQASPGAPDLWPWMQVLRALAADGSEADDSVAASPQFSNLGMPLAELRTASGLNPAASPEAERFQLFESILGFLKHLARDEPLLVLLDDMQWADVPSLLLFAFVARELGDACLLLVGAFSDAGMPHALARTVGALSREDPRRRLALTPLTPAEVERLALAQLGRAPLDVVQRLCDKSGGNPALLQQLLSGLTRDAHDATLASDTSALLTDQGVREAIGMQFDGLSKTCQGLLSIAAAFGTEFEVAALARVAGVSTSAAIDTLAEGIDMRVLRRTARAGEYGFVHALVRDVLYRRLSAVHQSELLAAIDKALSS